LNHGITILERARNSLLYLEAFYVRALVNAVSICISREFERLKEMSGLKAGQHLEAEVQAQQNSEALEAEVQTQHNSEALEAEVQAQQNSEALEAEVQAQHNSEALEGGVRLIRDILMEEESPLAPRILGRALDIVKELVHMFERFCETEDEVGDRNFSRFICVNNCEIHCVHYRIAQDGLDISEAISRKGGPLFDVEVLRKFVSDLTEDI
jgi:hypothetical protein